MMYNSAAWMDCGTGGNLVAISGHPLAARPWFDLRLCQRRAREDGRPAGIFAKETIWEGK